MVATDLFAPDSSERKAPAPAACDETRPMASPTSSGSQGMQRPSAPRSGAAIIDEPDSENSLFSEPM